MIVVADSSPLQYLVQIGHEILLPKLYERVIAPHGVIRELSHPYAPEALRLWCQKLPSWVELRATHAPREAGLDLLGLGESEAIQIAVDDPSISLVLLDDRRARMAAQRRNLRITGTLGVLLDAAGLNLVDPQLAYRRLIAETNFRTSASLERQFLDRLT